MSPSENRHAHTCALAPGDAEEAGRPGAAGPGLGPPWAGALSWLHTPALPGMVTARIQAATQVDGSLGEKHCRHPARRSVGEDVTEPGSDTYCYPQDRRLHGGPFVLPAVYDQDEPDASIL